MQNLELSELLANEDHVIDLTTKHTFGDLEISEGLGLCTLLTPKDVTSLMQVARNTSISLCSNVQQFRS